MIFAPVAADGNSLATTSAHTTDFAENRTFGAGNMLNNQGEK